MKKITVTMFMANKLLEEVGAMVVANLGGVRLALAKRQRARGYSDDTAIISAWCEQTPKSGALDKYTNTKKFKASVKVEDWPHDLPTELMVHDDNIAIVGNVVDGKVSPK